MHDIVDALRFRISTWNCFGMAQGISAVAALRAPFSARFRDVDVISECASPDILCLQELLSREAQQFFDGVGAEHFTSRFRDDNRVRFGGSVTMRGCGLGIGARWPLTKTVLRTFPGARVGLGSAGAQGRPLYAALVRRERHRRRDHGTSPGGIRRACHQRPRSAARRPKGPHRLRRVRRSPVHRRAATSTSMGSRVRVATPNIRALLPPCAGSRISVRADDLPTFDPHPGGNGLAYALEPDTAVQRIDYIFWRPARGPIDLLCTKTGRFFDKPLGQTTLRDGKFAWASDHYGLSVTFELDGRAAI